MNRDEAESVYTDMLANFEHQPISPNQRDQWTSYLVTVTAEGTAREALARCVKRGGSTFANERGRRPGVAEFASIVTEVLNEERRAQPAWHPAEEIPGRATRAERAIAEIRSSVPALANRKGTE